MNNLESSTKKIYENLTKELIKYKYSISTMESCTAGLVATFLTNVQGASEIIKGAFVTYCNEAKVLQGVNQSTIDTYGVYSKETALDMAVACQNSYKSNFGIGVTGTLDRPDPNNTTTSGIYYAISFNKDGQTYLFTNSVDIPDSITDRFKRKLYVINNIGVHLSDIISELD